MGKAEAAGGRVVKEAAAGQYGACYGSFSDPDGYLWTVVAASSRASCTPCGHNTTDPHRQGATLTARAAGVEVSS